MPKCQSKLRRRKSAIHQLPGVRSRTRVPVRCLFSLSLWQFWRWQPISLRILCDRLLVGNARTISGAVQSLIKLWWIKLIFLEFITKKQASAESFVLSCRLIIQFNSSLQPTPAPSARIRAATGSFIIHFPYYSLFFAHFSFICTVIQRPFVRTHFIPICKPRLDSAKRIMHNGAPCEISVPPGASLTQWARWVIPAGYYTGLAKRMQTYRRTHTGGTHW